MAIPPLAQENDQRIWTLGSVPPRPFRGSNGGTQGNSDYLGHTALSAAVSSPSFSSNSWVASSSPMLCRARIDPSQAIIAPHRFCTWYQRGSRSNFFRSAAAVHQNSAGILIELSSVHFFQEIMYRLAHIWGQRLLHQLCGSLGNVLVGPHL